MTAPRWTRALLRFLAPTERVDEVLGDLEEAHRRRVHRRGRGTGTLLTAVEALDMGFAIVRQRVAGRSGFSLLDFKLGFRMLARYPGLSLVGGLSMAFAIAIGAAGFEAINQVVSPALPFPEGDRIVGLRNWDVAANRVDRRAARDLLAWREGLESVRELGAFRRTQRNLVTERGESAPIVVTEVSASAFSNGRRAPGHPRASGPPARAVRRDEPAGPLWWPEHDDVLDRSPGRPVLEQPPLRGVPRPRVRERGPPDVRPGGHPAERDRRAHRPGGESRPYHDAARGRSPGAGQRGGPRRAVGRSFRAEGRPRSPGPCGLDPVLVGGPPFAVQRRLHGRADARRRRHRRSAPRAQGHEGVEGARGRTDRGRGGAPVRWRVDRRDRRPGCAHGLRGSDDRVRRAAHGPDGLVRPGDSGPRVPVRPTGGGRGGPRSPLRGSWSAGSWPSPG